MLNKSNEEHIELRAWLRAKMFVPIFCVNCFYLLTVNFLTNLNSIKISLRFDVVKNKAFITVTHL